MNRVDYGQILQLAAPEAILVLAALAILFVDLGGMRTVERRYRRMVGATLACLGCFVAGLWTFEAAGTGTVGNGLLVVDPLTTLVQRALLGLAAFAAVASVDADFTGHVGEFFAMLLLAAVGMLLLAATENLLMIFLALELTSLSLYVLTAFDKANPHSAEAALKYFLFGGMAAAFTLFGFSLLYGLSGAIDLRGIAAALGRQPFDPLLAVALVMTLVGLGFKIAAVPFHLWAPDAYQAAPAPSAGWIGSGSKVAGFVVLVKVMLVGFGGAEGAASWRSFAPGWVPLLAVMAALSIVWGNLAAIVQVSVKRLLAYSAVAHAGYALLGVVSNSLPGVTATIFYMITYAAATLGAFAIAGMVEDQARDARLADFAGLSRRAPLMSLCLLVFLLSLAGIPPLAGFFGKFYLFSSVLSDAPRHLALLWLVVLAVLMSAVSLYYYLVVLKQVYVAESAPDAPALRPGAAFQAAVVGLALATLLLGCLPDWLVGPVTAALAGGL